MPEVICDTSPLQYLHQIELLDLLRRMYAGVIVPRAVAEELAAGLALGVNVPVLTQFTWIQIRQVSVDAEQGSE